MSSFCLSSIATRWTDAIIWTVISDTRTGAMFRDGVVSYDSERHQKQSVSA
jgi:hypothetical protein